MFNSPSAKAGLASIRARPVRVFFILIS